MMITRIKSAASIAFATLLLPTISFAQVIQSGEVEDEFDAISTIVGAAFPVIIGLAVLLFLWGLLGYMRNADNVEARIASRSLMLWGIVIIFVMISVWGLVNFLGDVIDLESDDVPDAPGLFDGTP